MLLPLYVGVLCLFLVFFFLCPFIICNHIAARERERERERERINFTLIVFLLFVAVSLPRGVDWPVVCDCEISKSYLLVFFKNLTYSRILMLVWLIKV